MDNEKLTEDERRRFVRVEDRVNLRVERPEKAQELLANKALPVYL